MRFSILSLLLVAAAQAAPSTSGSETGIPDKGIENPVQWEVQAFKDGPVLTLSGTVQEMHSQLLEINPNYNADFELDTKLAARADLPVKRTNFNGAHTICGNFASTTVDNLDNGINYLRRVGGRPHMNGGPGACGRVSCSYNTAIWWCNDSRSGKDLNSFGSIADGAQHIWAQCAGRLDYGLAPGQVSGQVFHPTSWNVIVRKDKC